MKHPFLFALLFAVSAASASKEIYPSGFQFTKKETIIVVINIIESKEVIKKEKKPKEKNKETSLKLICSKSK
jgi:hypothetical protein